MDTILLQRGDIVCVHGTSVVDLAIEAVERSPISHVAIVSNPHMRVLTEIDFGRTCGTIKLAEYQGYCTIMRLTDGLDAEQRERIHDWLIRQYGKKYRLKDVMAEFMRYEFGYTPNRYDLHMFICSTLVDAAYKSIGIDLTGQPLPSPADVYDSPKLTKLYRY